MKKAVLASLLAVCAVNTSHANSYFVGQVFETTFNDFCTAFPRCSETDEGLRAGFGYQFNRHFALEIGYADMGAASVNIGTRGLESKVNAVDLVAVTRIPLGGENFLTAQFGAASVENRTSYYPSADEARSTVATYGFGFQFSWLTISYEVLRDMEYAAFQHDIEDDLTRIGAGVKFQF